jgi:hypothetical protein
MRSFWFCYLAPVLAVWLIGCGLAISRWPRHPRVSALLLLGLGSMIVSNLVLQIGVPAIAQQLRSQGTTGDRMQLLVSLFIIGMSPLRIVGWVSVLAAIFSGRESTREQAAARKPLQFSILGLLITTAVVAVLCALVRLLIDILGESSIYLVSLIDDIPIVICWLGGGWLAISRWRAHPQVYSRALAGIGLTAVVFLANQVLWIFVAISQSAYAWLGMSTGLSTIVMPIAWSLLVIAALGWRNDGQQHNLPQRAGTPLT